MLNLNEFRSRAKSFPDLLNYALSPDDGIVQTKSGGLIASWYYRGRDLHAATPEELASISARLSACLSRLGDGWMLHADAMRKPANLYPASGAFPDPTSRLIDEERRQQFLTEGAHYETFFALSLTYHPPLTAQGKAGDFMYEGRGASSSEGSAQRILDNFRRAVDDFENIFSTLFLARRMRGVAGADDFGQTFVLDEQLQYFEYCISGIDRPVRLPSIPMYLDTVVGSHPFVGGNDPKIGERWIKCIAVDGFPQDSYPGILNGLDELAVEYRWSTRFIFQETYRARQMLEKFRRKWQQKQRGLLDQMFRTSRGVLDVDAVAMTADTEQAIGEAESSLVGFGYYTTVVILLGADRVQLAEDARRVTKAFMNAGFGARVEEANAVEAYLGSLPGHHHQNVRRPLLHTLNLADMMPITAVWAGLEHNPCQYFPARSPALCYGQTTGATPFRLNLHVGDVGHGKLLGKTRGGKSTALALLMAQWLRYPGSQVFAFDKGYSLYALTHACGGLHYDLGGEKSKMQFCPLADIDTESDRAWAADWVRGCLEMQGVAVNAVRVNLIREAIMELVNSSDRSLTKFQALLQDTEMRAAMEPYTLRGGMGFLLDGQDNEGFRMTRLVTFELEHLMAMGEANYAPLLLYLFRAIEKRLTGVPTFVPVDEAWLAFKIGVFREKLEDWSRTWGKKNASLFLATQNLGDVLSSELAPIILQNFPTTIFLPNPEATTESFAPLYKGFGLNGREIDMTERRDYYYASPLGRRRFSFGMKPVTLSFVGAGGMEDIKRCNEFIKAYGEQWPAEWLRDRGLGDWADYWQELAAQAQFT